MNYNNNQCIKSWIYPCFNMKECNRHVGNSPMWEKPTEYKFHFNCLSPWRPYLIWDLFPDLKNQDFRNKKLGLTILPSNAYIHVSVFLDFLLDCMALWVGRLRKVGIDLQCHRIGLHQRAWLQKPFTQRNSPFELNLYMCRNIVSKVGLKQVGINSLFGHHLLVSSCFSGCI